MAGKLRATMEYLGLAEADPHYRGEDYAGEWSEERYDEAADSGYPVEDHREPAPVTHLHKPAAPTADYDQELSAMSRINTIHPRTYNEAKEIGESFRDGVPVIMNLSDMDDNDAKRLVDFAAGLVFGLHGSIERVTNKVFLLSPEHIEVDAEGAEGAQPRALFNQS